MSRFNCIYIKMKELFKPMKEKISSLIGIVVCSFISFSFLIGFISSLNISKGDIYSTYYNNNDIRFALLFKGENSGTSRKLISSTERDDYELIYTNNGSYTSFTKISARKGDNNFISEMNVVHSKKDKFKAFGEEFTLSNEEIIIPSYTANKLNVSEGSDIEIVLKENNFRSDAFSNETYLLMSMKVVKIIDLGSGQYYSNGHEINSLPDFFICNNDTYEKINLESTYCHTKSYGVYLNTGKEIDVTSSYSGTIYYGSEPKNDNEIMISKKLALYLLNKNDESAIGQEIELTLEREYVKSVDSTNRTFSFASKYNTETEICKEKFVVSGIVDDALDYKFDMTTETYNTFRVVCSENTRDRIHLKYDKFAYESSTLSGYIIDDVSVNALEKAFSKGYIIPYEYQDEYVNSTYSNNRVFNIVSLCVFVIFAFVTSLIIRGLFKAIKNDVLSICEKKENLAFYPCMIGIFATLIPGILACLTSPLVIGFANKKFIEDYFEMGQLSLSLVSHIIVFALIVIVPILASIITYVVSCKGKIEK